MKECTTHHICDCQNAKLKLLERENARLREALEFYGLKAVHNPLCGDKGLQFWTEAGIWDHGEIARKALGIEK